MNMRDSKPNCGRVKIVRKSKKKQGYMLKYGVVFRFDFVKRYGLRA